MSIEPTRPRHLGKYELQTRLGRGGMAEVWKAFDPQLRRHVAIKLMLTELHADPDFLARFEREARLVASLDHPNIVRIHDFHISQPPESQTPTPYMVMDYVKGQTFSDYIASTSRLGNIPSWNDLIYLFAVISRALDYAHQKGMIHRDIKPANILLDQRLPGSGTRTMGEPILTDFGVARMQGAQTGTLLGALVGTPLYIAPEQAIGQHTDRRCDLYSLGIILYEITTGVTPFRAETTLAILMQHLNTPPTPPALINPHIPPAVSEIILKSIAKRPEDRYASATDMTTALAQALNIPLPGRSNSSISNPGLFPGTPPYPLTPIDMPTPGISPALRYSTIKAQEYKIPAQPITPPYSPPQARPTQNPSPSYTPYFGFVPEGPEQIQRQQPPHISNSPYSQPTQPKSINRRTLLLGFLLFILVLGTGLSIVALTTNSSPASSTPIVGHVLFFRSTHAAIGNYDQIQIDISHVSPPPPGYVYYAWLVGNTLENSPAHWQLLYTNGRLYLNRQSYIGLANLLKPNTLFLVTQETTDSLHTVPYTNPQARFYYAQIPDSSLTRFNIKPCPSNDSTHICSSSISKYID
jgi:eukaryotic-like serine/threonine-protein kinase